MIKQTARGDGKRAGQAELLGANCCFNFVYSMSSPMSEVCDCLFGEARPLADHRPRSVRAHLCTSFVDRPVCKVFGQLPRLSSRHSLQRLIWSLMSFISALRIGPNVHIKNLNKLAATGTVCGRVLVILLSTLPNLPHLLPQFPSQLSLRRKGDGARADPLPLCHRPRRDRRTTDGH